jgi:drug/metabolite transporter (DMT)-like permease
MNPRLCLIIGVICISFSPIFVKLAGAAPISAAFYRVFIAWLCVLPYCIAKKKLRIDRSHLFIALTAGAVFALDISVWNISLLKISATISTLIANLAPLWVGLLSFLLFKKRESASFWIGTIVAIAGMVLLVGFGHVIHLQLNLGILLALCSSLLYATYILITKKSMAKMDGFTFMFYSMIGAGVTSFIMCFVMNDPVAGFTSRIWLCFIAMGLICQLTGWLTINYAIHHMEPTKVSVTLLSQTVIAGVLAAILLTERLDLKEIIGSVIVLAGIAITFLKPRNQSGKIVS